MSTTLLIIFAVIGGIAGGFAIAKFLEKSNISNMIKNAKKEAASILKDANLESENIKKDKLLQAKEKFLELKAEHEQEILNKDKRIAETEKYPQGHPMMAQPALQQGDLLGENIINLVNKKPLKPFEYNDKGSMATIGRNLAVVDLPNYHFSGIFAWFVWMFLHLMLIVSVRNKLIIFINWAWAYFTKDTSLRLILRQKTKK